MQLAIRKRRVLGIYNRKISLHHDYGMQELTSPYLYILLQFEIHIPLLYFSP